MKQVAWVSGFAVAAASAMAPAHALPKVAAGAAVGTQGIGGQFTFELIPWVNLRVAAQGFGFNRHFEKDNTVYSGKLHLFSYGGLFDIYPFTRGPRFSIGLYDNHNRADIHSDCWTTSCQANELTIQGGNATFDGRFNFHSPTPYAGIGWGNAMAGELPFYVSFDLGVMFQGLAKVTLNASGTGTVTDQTTGQIRTGVSVGTDPAVQSQLVQEQGIIAGELHSYRYFPVAMLGIGWRF
jgi:hypothetical protein